MCACIQRIGSRLTAEREVRSAAQVAASEVAATEVATKEETAVRARVVEVGVAATKEVVAAASACRLVP